MADVEHTQKMIPFITCEISLCQYVCELVLTASLSSKIHNKASLREECTFEEIKPTLSGILSRWKFVKLDTNYVHVRVSPFLIVLIRISVKNSNDQISQVKRGFSVHP